jgi:hypothetical protein
MSSILSCPWLGFAQTGVGLVGTWVLAFGLKSIRETAGTFNTSDPHPVSWRFWVGLVLLTVAGLPNLLSPFVWAG